MSEPISSENMELLEKSNQKLNSWFHRHSTDVDPIYQSYSKPQDRNRMKIPYNLVRMYVLCNKMGSFRPFWLLRLLTTPGIRTAMSFMD